MFTGIITPTTCAALQGLLGPESPFRWSDQNNAVHLCINVLKLLVADAVYLEPVSASEFPANREIYREFRRIRPPGSILEADTHGNSRACSGIPYAKRTGNYFEGTGNSSGGTGNFTCKYRNCRRIRFPVLTAN
jgi:hypothetical protein